MRPVLVYDARVQPPLNDLGHCAVKRAASILQPCYARGANERHRPLVLEEIWARRAALDLDYYPSATAATPSRVKRISPFVACPDQWPRPPWVK